MFMHQKYHLCVCVCVWERERERERETYKGYPKEKKGLQVKHKQKAENTLGKLTSWNID